MCGIFPEKLVMKGSQLRYQNDPTGHATQVMQRYQYQNNHKLTENYESGLWQSSQCPSHHTHNNCTEWLHWYKNASCYILACRNYDILVSVSD